MFQRQLSQRVSCPSALGVQAHGLFSDPLSPLPRRLINGHASNSSREISADDENGETGSLAILTNFDRNRRSASGGSSRPIDLTADDDAPGASRPRRPTPPPNGSIYPSLPPERLFDEGALNPDSPSSAYGSNGTVDSQQSEDHEPELPETSETEESPENPLSPTPPPQSYPVRRKPSRPDVRLDPSSRDYSWLRISPGSTSSRSSGSSKRSSSKFHSSPSTNLRSSKQRRQLQSRAEDRQRLMKLKNLVGKTGERGEVGHRVMEMFRPTRISAPSRIEERLFQRREFMLGAI